MFLRKSCIVLFWYKQCNVINFYLCWFKFNKTKFETKTMNVNFQQLDCFAARLICDEPVLANRENLIISEI